MKRLVIVFFLVTCAVVPARAVDEQVRAVVHPTVKLSDRWFAAGWIIANGRADSPDNFNLLGGVGYRTKRWSSEVLLHRQWSHAGGQWYLGSRSYGTLAGVSLYHEFAPFLGKAALYQLTMAEVPAFKGFGVGAETENVYRRGRDILAAGPRISRKVFQTKHIKGVAALSYQFRRDSPDAVRLWLIVHPTF